MCKYKEKTGEELKKEARDFGLSDDNWYNEKDNSFRDAAVQARVKEAKRAQRENRLWIIALISALASFFSAIAGQGIQIFFAQIAKFFFYIL